MTFEAIQWLCIILGIVIVLMIIMLIFISKKYGKLLKTMNKREVDSVNIKKGVRYTEDQTVVDENGDMNVSLGQNDIVLSQYVPMVVDKKGKLKPGKYTILGSHAGEDKFNIRVGSYVKEYGHNEKIVLSEGEEVTAISTTVILR